MGSYRIPETAIAELNTLATAIQTVTELEMDHSSNIRPVTLLLIARIAATSPTIHSVDLHYNMLGVHQIQQPHLRHCDTYILCI